MTLQARKPELSDTHETSIDTLEGRKPVGVSPEGGSGRRRMEKSADAFRTIGEAADELELKAHVLRFWETKFKQLTPMKRKDGRRFYRPEDMNVLRILQELLHVQGMTIKGAQRLLSTRGVSALVAELIVLEGDDAGKAATASAGKSVHDLQNAVRFAVEGGAFQGAAQDDASRDRLEHLLDDLTGLKSRLDQVRTAS